MCRSVLFVHDSLGPYKATTWQDLKQQSKQLVMQFPWELFNKCFCGYLSPYIAMLKQLPGESIGLSLSGLLSFHLKYGVTALATYNSLCIAKYNEVPQLYQHALCHDYM